MAINPKDRIIRIDRSDIYEQTGINTRWENSTSRGHDIPWENDAPWDEEYTIEELDKKWDVPWENDVPWEIKRKKSKVAVIPCYSYEQDKVDAAVAKGIELIGGIGRFVIKNEKVLFKPNLLTRADDSRAVTTHPAVFEAIIKLFQNEGYENLSYGDSPGHPGNIKKTAEVCGLSEVAERLDIPMADFDSGSTVEFISGRLNRKYDICNAVLDSDAIVSICKMKTHQLEIITGAVKNLFGCVHGLSKSASHAKFPDAQSFAQMLVELNLIIKPRLHIMDGIVAMEGNGPSSGKPRKMNVLLFSDDPVALDATFCRLIDLDEERVPTVYYGEKLYLGNSNRHDIEIVGVPNLKHLTKKDFDCIREGEGEMFFWKIFNHLKLVNRRPVVDKSRCKKCGICVETCPIEEKAVQYPKGNKDRFPEFDYKKCIRCYCCQEMCPEGAISNRLGFGK